MDRVEVISLSRPSHTVGGKARYTHQEENSLKILVATGGL
jgi:hypothetical protein